MSDVSGAGSLGPHEKKMYEQEYKQSADLFKHALNRYAKSDDPYQKAEFNDVMDKAMQILNQTANELMRKELQKQNEQIAKDYAAFKKHPEDEGALGKLNQDLDNAKKSIK